MADFTEAIRLDPMNSKAFNGRGAVSSETKQFEKALADYNEAIRLDPKNSHEINNRGIVARIEKAIRKNIADFNEAIRYATRKTPRRLTAVGVFRYVQQATGIGRLSTQRSHPPRSEALQGKWTSPGYILV